MAVISLTCPHCGYTGRVPQARIPFGAVEVNCPRCHGSFPLRAPAAPSPRGEAAPETATPGEPPVPRPRPTKLYCVKCGYSRLLPPTAPFELRVPCPQCGTLLTTDQDGRKQERQPPAEPQQPGPRKPPGSPPAASEHPEPKGAGLIRFRDFLRRKWPGTRGPIRMLAAAVLSLLCASDPVWSAPLAPVPRPDHVVVVIEENKRFDQVIGNPEAPYLNALARQGVLFTNSFGIAHPSQPNYLALFSGSTQGVDDNRCPYTFWTPNLASALLEAKLSFASFAEDLPSVGYTGCRVGDYVRRHNPYVNWQGTVLPASGNRPLSDFRNLEFHLLPTVSFLIPNLRNDMHDGSVRRADRWLEENIEPYLHWAQTHNSLLILTFDEDDGSGDNRIATIMVGPMLKPGSYPQRIDHYTVLRALEEMYRLPLLGGSAQALPLVNVWKTK